MVPLCCCPCWLLQPKNRAAQQHSAAVGMPADPAAALFCVLRLAVFRVSAALRVVLAVCSAALAQRQIVYDKTVGNGGCGEVGAAGLH